MMQRQPDTATTTSKIIFPKGSLRGDGLWYSSQSALAKGKSVCHGWVGSGELNEPRVPPYALLPPTPMTLPSKNREFREFCKA